MKTPNLPCAVGGLGSPARSKISPNPPLPAPLSLLEPRWPPVVPLASPCHSCCLSPLCCYHCCSPAPTPYVSIKTRTSHASTDLSFPMQLPFEIHLSYLIHNDDMILSQIVLILEKADVISKRSFVYRLPLLLPQPKEIRNFTKMSRAWFDL